jgi:L-2,4-diaminobutyrate decarboxylase
MMLMPLSAGMVLVRHGKDLERAFAQSAPYLFHGADSETALSPDLGKRSFQCSRRAEALKVWVALQRLGVDGVGGLYNHLCEHAVTLRARLVAERITPLHAPESNILCWRESDCRAGAGFDARAAANRSGAWITQTRIAGVAALRVTVMNPRSATEHVDRLARSLTA